MTTTRSPIPDVSSSPRARGPDSRTRLVHAAARLVHAESYRSVGVKDICDAAAVHRGSFYHYFESKQALVLAALDLTWQRFRLDGLASCADGSLPPRTRIEKMIEHAASSQARDKDRTGQVHGCAFGNLAAEAATLDDRLRERLERIFEEWAEIAAEPLDEAQQAGDIGDCAPPLTIACELIASLQGLIMLAKVRNDPDIIADGGRVILDQLWGCDHRG